LLQLPTSLRYLLAILLLENAVMPKTVDYPRASLAKSLSLAEAVYELGGSTTIEICAEHMDRRVGGGFRDIVSAAVKYGLVTTSKGSIRTTQLFKEYHLGYTDQEKIDILRGAFSNVPLFNEICARFDGRAIPLEILDRLLVREFDVTQQVASKVSKHFLEAAKSTGIVSDDNLVNLVTEPSDAACETQPSKIVAQINATEQSDVVNISARVSGNDSYSVIISGPGMNHTITIKGP
jgi:hypothetical protein